MTDDGGGRVALLLRGLDEGFDRSAWHGPNLWSSLRGVTAERAAWRQAPGRHNVWELAVHCAYWKYVVRRRVTGDRSLRFPLAGSNFFARGGESGERGWKADRALLRAEHAALREVVAALADDDLGGVDGSRRVRLVQGAAMHDVYHAGQIRLLLRLAP
jgi:hypothetical protein